MFDKQLKYASGEAFHALELENYFIDYIPGTLNQLVFTFENADQPKRPRLDGLREPWGARVLRRKGYSVIGIKPKAADWYRGDDLHRFFRSHSLKIFMSSFNQIFLYGSSMGGYAAMAFADACPGASVIAFNPQSTLHADLVPWETRFPEGRAQNWSGDFADARYGVRRANKVYVAYDPLFALDYKHIDRIENANLVRLKMPLVGHVVTVWMNEAKILSTFLDEALAGTLTEQRCQQLARTRRMLPRYYFCMGMRARSARVAFRCLQKLAGMKLNSNAGNEFFSILMKHRLWDAFTDREIRSAIIRFEDNVVAGPLKSLSDQGRPDVALEICEEIMAKREPHWQILVLAAECLQRLSRLPEAEAYARRAAAQAPNMGNCYRILARILYEAGKVDEACEMGQKGVAAEPGSWPGWLDLIKYHESLERLDVALDCAQRASLIKPNDKAIAEKIRLLGARLDKTTQNAKS